MPEIEVNINDAQVRKMIDDLRRRAPGYISSAVNKTAKGDVRQIIKEISTISSIKQKDIRQGKVGRVWSTKARPPQHKSLIKIRGRPLTIGSRFRAKQLRKGVRAKVFGKTRTYRGAFIIEKFGFAFKRDYGGRWEINRLLGPDIRAHRITDAFWRGEEKFLDARLFKELDSQAQRLTRRYR